MHIPRLVNSFYFILNKVDLKCMFCIYFEMYNMIYRRLFVNGNIFH